MEQQNSKQMITYSINYVNINLITIIACFLLLLFYFIIFKSMSYYIQNIYNDTPCNLIEGVSNAKCNKYLSENIRSHYSDKQITHRNKLEQLKRSMESIGSSMNDVNQDKDAFLNSLKSTAIYSTTKLMDIIKGIYNASQTNLGDLYTQYNLISNQINNNLVTLVGVTLPKLQKLANQYHFSNINDPNNKYRDYYNAIYNMINNNMSFFQKYFVQNGISNIPNFDTRYGV